MAKQTSHPAPKVRQDNVLMRITIDPRKAAKKIRKVMPPMSKLHRVATTYRRKPKHPHRTDD